MASNPSPKKDSPIRQNDMLSDDEMINTAEIINQTKEQCEKEDEKMQEMEERMLEWMENNAKEQAKKMEDLYEEQTNRLEEVVRNGMQEMKTAASEQNMAGMAGTIAALNTKMDVSRREVRNEDAAPNFLELIRSVYGVESPELQADVKRIEELIPMIPEEKRNEMLLEICRAVEASLEMALL